MPVPTPSQKASKLGRLKREDHWESDIFFHIHKNRHPLRLTESLASYLASLLRNETYVSVTRFGGISRLWTKSSVWQYFEDFLVKFLCNWANYSCCKWPHIEESISDHQCPILENLYGRKLQVKSCTLGNFLVSATLDF